MASAPSLAAFPATCPELRDCDCCGARSSLACADTPDHDGVHLFVCRRCGKDPAC